MTHNATITPAPNYRIAIFAFFSLFAAFFPIYIFGEYPRISTMAIHIASLILLPIIICWIVHPHSEKFVTRLHTHADRLLSVVLVALIATMVVINSIKFYNFSFVGVDILHFSQSLNTALFHNKFFYSTEQGYTFAWHFRPIVFLVLPFYRLFPHPLMLIFLKVILLSLSSIPLYMLAKDTLSKGTAFMATLCYLISVPICNQLFSEYYPLQFTPLFLLGAYYFFRKNMFAPFLFFLLLLLSVREEMGLLSVMFGILAIVAQKKKRWVFIPLIIGSAWLAISYFWIIPFFSPSGTYYMPNLTGNGSLSLQSIAKNIFLVQNVRYIYFLLAPFLFILPFLSVEFLLCAPFIAGVLMCGNLRVKAIGMHYHVFIVAILFIATIHSIRRLSDNNAMNRFFSGSKNLQLAFSVIMLAVTANITVYYNTGFIDSMTKPYRYKSAIAIADYKKSVNEVFGLIPQDAKLVVPRYLSLHVCNRSFILTHLKKNDLRIHDVDYIVIDDNTEDYQVPLEELRKNSVFESIYNKNGIHLYRKERARDGKQGN